MKIQVVKGTYDETCTKQTNLTENQASFPAIKDVIMYAEPRMLSTLIVAGAKDAQSVGKVPTKIGIIPSNKMVGSSGYRYAVQGRIQLPSVIIDQVGSSGADGSFTLRLKDNYLYNGMIAVFHGSQYQARVMGDPSGSPGNYIYNFQNPEGIVFSWATHVAPQTGEKTCFGSTSSYGEKSLRGYGRSYYADVFINHMTIQRKTIGISGDVGSDTLWYMYKGQKGWLFAKERQARLQFMMEDEFNKWFGRSTMRNADGSLRTKSRLTDEKGDEIIQGDGIEAQIEGGNVSYGSGPDGNATLDDIKDMMSVCEKKSDMITGKKWYCVTGTDGMSVAQDLLETKATSTFNINIDKSGSTVVGGPEVQVGYNFTTYNVNGNQVVFVKHPLFDDEQRWTERGSDGKILRSGDMFFLDASPAADGTPNIEILTKGAYGANRTMVSAYLNGLTGIKQSPIISEVDGIKFAMLKQDLIAIYNTATCGIIRKSA